MEGTNWWGIFFMSSIVLFILVSLAYAAYKERQENKHTSGAPESRVSLYRPQAKRFDM